MVALSGCAVTDRVVDMVVDSVATVAAGMASGNGATVVAVMVAFVLPCVVKSVAGLRACGAKGRKMAVVGCAVADRVADVVIDGAAGCVAGLVDGTGATAVVAFAVTCVVKVGLGLAMAHRRRK